ncbi:MAG: hypothetical protein Q9M76_04185, partial [Candidatus Dojkabacteria bacterium]|nr:hypothetical protein [Candidatus Dojkabacteria bacterium]
MRIINHNRISLTAYYTSYVYSRSSGNTAIYKTFRGAVLYYILMIPNLISLLILKTNLNRLLSASHRLILEECIKTIEVNNIKQIIEIGSGFSDFSIILKDKFSEIKYIEIDLENVLKAKQKLNPVKDITYSSINIFSDSASNDLNKIIDVSLSTLIIAEGFINYFSSVEVKIFLSNIDSILNQNNKNILVLDSLMQSNDEPSTLVKTFKSILSKCVNTNVYFHFKEGTNKKVVLDDELNLQVESSNLIDDKIKQVKSWRV